MFDSLDEQIKKDEAKTSKQDKVMRWVIAAVSLAVVCGGIVLGLRLMNS